MKHIYLFNSNSCAGAYGIGTYFHELVACIKGESDVRITIVELQSTEKEFSVTEMEGVRCIKIPSPNVSYWPVQSQKQGHYSLAVSCLLKQQVNANENNVFHLNYIQQDSLVQHLRNLSPSCKIVFTVHYMEWCTLIKGDRGYFKEIIQKDESERTDITEKSVYNDYSRTKAMCQSVDKVICLSSSTFNLLQAEYGIPKEQLALVPNGLRDEAVSVDEEQKRAIKRGMAFNGNEKIVLFVGRLDEAKGLLLLLNAFKKVTVHSPNAHLIIAGSGYYDGFLKESSPLCGKVSFTGKVEKEFLYRLYQIADVGVHPSLNEQCSYVAIEMMMHGIPLVGVDSAGIGEMIESGYNGYKVCPKQIEQLEERIIEVLHNSRLRKKLGRNSRTVYQSLYKAVKMKNAVLEIYFK